MAMARGDGRIYLRGKTWWLAWCLNGREHRESSGSQDAREARRQLRIRLGQLAKGERPAARARQLRVDAALDLYAKDRDLAKRWSESTQQAVAWLRRHFGAWRVVDVTLPALTEWAAAQKATNASGSLRRYLAMLKAALTTARRAGLTDHRADYPRLAASPPRRGFYTPLEASAHLAAFTDPEHADLAEFLYVTGWRITEGRCLTWAEVDRSAGVVTLAAERTKTRQGRVRPIVGRLAALLERRFKARRLGCPWVFHRRGRTLSDSRFRAAWHEAGRAAGLPRRIPHDLRRSMSRDQVRAGVSRRVAMENTGHQDERVFEDYDITVLEDQARAVLATEAYRAANSDKVSDSGRVSG